MFKHEFLELHCIFEVLIIVKIDSITQSFYLHHNVQTSLSYLAEETKPTLCKRTPNFALALHLLEQIKISCYTEYKAFGPSLIYNIMLVSELNVITLKMCHIAVQKNTCYLTLKCISFTCVLFLNHSVF